MRKIADILLSPEDGFEGRGPLGLEGKDPTQAGEVFSDFISTVIGLITIIAFIWFTFLMVTGGYGFMSAGGDKQALETARKKITTGIVGVIIVIAAVFIVDLIGELIGIPEILNPAKLIETIAPKK